MSFDKKNIGAKRTVNLNNPESVVNGANQSTDNQVNEETQQLVAYDPSQTFGALGSWHGGELPTIFSTNRPRDLPAGLSSGVKNVLRGVSLGVASLVAAPAYGAHQGGIGGFFKGLGAGVVMAIAFPVAGVTYGITQAARGAINTPEAVMAKREGKKWDKKEREWKDNWYSLEEDEAEVKVLESTYEEQKKEFRSLGQVNQSAPIDPKSVVDTTYYDCLGVAPDATNAEIRKAYYKLAKECHPDKNLDDPLSGTRFQELGEAYQVLGDEKRRSEYNKYGKDAAKGMPIIDSSLFFAMLFGSDALQPYVGKLKLAMFVETFEDQEVEGKFSESIMEFQQRKREVELAVLLRNRISEYLNASEAQRRLWKEKMTKEAQSLCSHNFGDSLVEAVGWTYENYSSQFLGKLDTFLGLGGKYAKLQAKNRDFSNFWKTATIAVKASMAARKLERVDERKQRAAEKTSSSKNEFEGVTESEEEQRARAEGEKQLEETLPLILETILSVCLFDVEATVRAASKKVLKDLATPIDTRKQRAEALIELGRIFQHEARQYKEKMKNEKIDVMKQMEEAFIRVAQENDEQQS